MKNFDAAQRAYDNMSDPRLEDDGAERETWEETIDWTDALDSDDINQVLWKYADRDAFLSAKLEKAWENYCQIEWENGNRKHRYL